MASRDKWRRMELLGRLQQFARDYRRALEAWRSGYEAVFPFLPGDEGRHELRVLFRARDGRIRGYPPRTFTWAR